MKVRMVNTIINGEACQVIQQQHKIFRWHWTNTWKGIVKNGARHGLWKHVKEPFIGNFHNGMWHGRQGANLIQYADYKFFYFKNSQYGQEVFVYDKKKITWSLHTVKQLALKSVLLTNIILSKIYDV